jgi:hypothetical protein
MADSKIVLDLEIDDNGAIKQIGGIKKRVEASGKEAGKSFSAGFSGEISEIGEKFSSVKIGAFAASASIAAAAGVLAGFVKIAKDGITEYNEADRAVRSFANAIEGTRAAGQGTIELFQQLGDELESTIGLDDKLVLQNAALIQSFANLDQQGLKRATLAAVEFAALTRTSFDSAADVITKVASGGVEQFNRAFKKFGITLDENLPKQEALNKALEAIENTAKGKAAASVTQLDRDVNKLSSTYETFTKSVGEAIVKSGILNGLLNSASSIISAITPSANNSENSIRKLNYELESSEKILERLEYYKKNQKGLFDQNAYNATIEKVKELRLQLDDARKAQTLSGERNIAKQNAEDQPQFSTKQIEEISAKIKSIGLTDAQEAKLRRDEELAAIIQAEEAGIATKIPYNERKLQIEQEYQDRLGQIKGTAQNAQLAQEQKSRERAAQVNAAINQSIAQTASLAIQSLTKSLVLGQKGFENFGKKVAGILGDMSTQLGYTLLLTGIGMESLFKLSGTQAIAAGAGLIALGTILKSFSGGESGGDTGASGQGAGGADFSGGGFSNPQIDQQQRQEPNTAVTVNIQGDVFDSEETGLRISRILKDASFNNNVQVIGVV